MRGVCDIFKRYTRIIHSKSTPSDPNFLAISAACGKIEQFIETIFPSSVKSTAQANLEAERAERTGAPMNDEERKEMYYVYAVIFAVWLVLGLLMTGIAWMFGARFDLMFEHIKDAISGLL